MLTVDLDRKEVERIIGFLIGAAGLLHHLGTEQNAVAALYSMHISKEVV
jgi:hypothetical protein